MTTSIFLTIEEVAELTGIRSGCKGKTRAERQAAALRHMGIPHYVNAAQRPIVARAVIEGGALAMAAATAQQADSWEPMTHH